MKLIFLLIFLPITVFGQNKQNFHKLIEETNHSLNQYSRLAAFNFDMYFSIESFGLSKQEVEELIEEADYDRMLSENKDSIGGVHMIFYFQEKIVEQIKQIVRHPDFEKANIKELINSDELSIVISDDNKLFNFSIDEKTGGTYRSRISVMHYTDFIHKDPAQTAEFNSFFASDGYSDIYTIKTAEGTKYVLTGYVRGCSYCFQTFVRLVTFKDNKFKEDFMYSVTNRDWNDGVIYNHETQTIFVDYHIDDLTQYCYCSGEFDEDKIRFEEIDPFKISINCQCEFIFNGLTFELVEESWKKVDIEDRRK